MRKVLRFLLLNPILWIVEKFSSSPDRERIFEALTKLNGSLHTDPGKKGFVIPLEVNKGKFILFSDQHKGAKNGADDFRLCEGNYLSALQHYDQEGFHLICLGDSEELWENTLLQVKKHNTLSFAAERKFALRNAFTKIFGNHDLDWEINPMAEKDLRELYHMPVAVLEGVILQCSIKEKPLSIFCTHGHQGDLQSDGNLFSKFFVSKIWAPLQAYLQIYPNTPAYNDTLKTEHNNIMYEWSSQQKNLILITGHTHQPVFESLTHLERLQRQEAIKRSEGRSDPQDSTIPLRSVDSFSKIRPTYFNTGCCCYSDGDISGIEISENCIKLIKWKKKDGQSVRIELENISFEQLAGQLSESFSSLSFKFCYATLYFLTNPNISDLHRSGKTSFNNDRRCPQHAPV
jgi:predicted phosphodiesterase